MVVEDRTIWSGCAERTYRMCVALTPAHKDGKPNMDERISTKRKLASYRSLARATIWIWNLALAF